MYKILLSLLILINSNPVCIIFPLYFQSVLPTDKKPSIHSIELLSSLTCSMIDLNRCRQFSKLSSDLMSALADLEIDPDFLWARCLMYILNGSIVTFGDFF